MNRKALAAIAIVIVLIATAYIGSPFWAARQFKAAALSADVDQLDAAVDFPAVRESLKSQMTVALTAKMQTDPEMRSNPFAGLGMVMMPAIIGRMVDGFVTPEGMSAMMKRGKMAKGGADIKANPNVDYDYDYRTLDRFAVTVKVPESKDDQTPKIRIRTPRSLLVEDDPAGAS